MREIKFRAWNGSQMIEPRSNCYYQHYLSFCGGIVQKSSEGMDCLGGGDVWRLVDKTVLMQYTGLKDCEGKEIYEGDIVRSEHFIDLDGEQHYVRHTCEWSNKYSGWYFRNNAESFDGDGGLQAFVMMKFLNARKIKIIGNIHQNPELIK